MPIKILADASLPALTTLFQTPFDLTLYQTNQDLIDLLPSHHVLLCRSTLRVNACLLSNSSIDCVATASSGTDHIDSKYLNQHNIQLFDAKGSNARAVADYVVSILAVHQPIGKLAGVIGVGEVGSRVVERLQAAGFTVICYDPLKTEWDKKHPYATLAELADCDLICIHANLHESAPFPSKNLINADFIAHLKSGVTMINASRGGIVDEDALLQSSQKIAYCTDVYCNEPSIDPRVINFATVCTPHIAGHSIEAKQAAMVQLSEQLHHYYKLPMTTAFEVSQHREVNDQHSAITWQDHVKQLYNPLTETQILKSAADKQNAFLTQRKLHQQRHDFNCYAMNTLHQWNKGLLGR